MPLVTKSRVSSLFFDPLCTATLALVAIYTSVSVADCVQTTTKDIKCPGITEQNCGGVVQHVITIPLNIPWLPKSILELEGKNIPYCERITWLRAETDAFGTKLNTPNETETQSDTDAADMVTCSTFGWCIIDPTNPASCIQKTGGTDDANPQEEIPCPPNP